MFFLHCVMGFFQYSSEKVGMEALLKRLIFFSFPICLNVCEIFVLCSRSFCFFGQEISCRIKDRTITLLQIYGWFLVFNVYPFKCNTDNALTVSRHY